MNVLFLYGPPAAGKLTVAKELEKLTGYALLHNHLINDLLWPIFPRMSPMEMKLNRSIRFQVIESAAKTDVKGLILTFGYVNKWNQNKYIADMQKLVKKHKGTMYFVQVCCSEKVLLKRVAHPSRKKYQKITHLKTLKQVLNDNNFQQVIPNTNTFTVDTTSTAAKTVARKIKSHYKL